MKFYRMLPTARSLSDSFLDTDREYSLPGVRCATCAETWANVGLIYPAFSLPPTLDPSHYRDRRPVSFEEYKMRSDPLQNAWNRDLPISPGLEFGKSFVKARGTFGDFAWKNSWCGFVSNRTLDRLAERGLYISVGDPEIDGESSFDYEELHIEEFLETRGYASEKLLESKCPTCGRMDHTQVSPEQLNVQPPPSNGSAIFRIRHWTTYIVVREDLAAAITELKLSGVELAALPC